MLRTKILILSLIVFVFIGSPAVAGTPLLSSSVEVLDVNESSGISVRLKFTLKNGSEDPIDVLTWGTPLENEWTNDCFDVRHDGRPVPYIGMLVKRGTPGPDDYIRIGAHQEVSAIVALAQGYEIYREGRYTVQYRADAISAKVSTDTEEESGQTESLIEAQPLSSSNLTEFTLVQGMDEPMTLSEPLAVYTCSESEMNMINAGYNAARSISLTARESLRNAPVTQRPQAQRYREWFGAYSASRYAIVLDHFDRIYDVLMNKHIGALCTDEDIYAKVNPNNPYHITFGKLFWSAPEYGTDSKAGTFVHEISHFKVVAGTKDHVYGQSGARNLAKINPDTAINNADNNEYFAENNPPLSMPGPSAPPPPPSGHDDDDDGGSSGCFIQTLGH